VSVQRILELSLLAMLVAFAVGMALATIWERVKPMAAALACFALVACTNARPTAPEQVAVVVERYKPLPAWATDPLVKPEPVDDTVGARLRSHEARGGVIDVANCDRLLLKQLDAGAAVDPKACGHE
jgi:hypothetical protein